MNGVFSLTDTNCKTYPEIPPEFVRRGRVLEVLDTLNYVVLVDLGFGIFQTIQGRLRGVEGVSEDVVNGILTPNREVLVRIYQQEKTRSYYIDLVFREKGGIPVNLAQFLTLNGWGTPNEEYDHYDRQDPRYKDLHSGGSDSSEESPASIRNGRTLC